MVSKTDDIPASVPNCNPVDLADEAGDGAQEPSKARLKDPCGCGEALQLRTASYLLLHTRAYYTYFDTLT